MKTFVGLFVFLILSAIYTDANPIIKESVAKQLFRSKRQDRPAKAGHPDEPMRLSVKRSKRAQETNMEHWHCYPRCDPNRNYGYPV